MVMIRPEVVGRPGVMPQGPAVAPAAGNAVITADVRGTPPAAPGAGGGASGVTLELGQRYVTRVHPSRARTPAFQHGRLIARDRHIIERTGTTHTSASDQQPASGIANPESSGPPRPAYEMLNRTISWTIGTGWTRNLNNQDFHATVQAGAGRVRPLGTQGDPWSAHWGGTPGLYQPYGSRGKVIGPAPQVRAAPGDASGLPPGTIISQGDPGDGPQRVYGGLPWGLHSPTVPAPVVTQARYRHTKQQRGPHDGRPQNSQTAGQSMNQFVQRLDGTGTPLPVGQATRQPGLGNRWRGTSS